jgi:hypothetical protein
MRSDFLLQGLGLFAGLAHAAPPGQAVEELAPRTDLVKRASCNTPSNRQCWTTDGFNISTDYEQRVPNTGNTRRVCP